MLGPEQINFAPRPAPLMIDGATIRVTEQVAKGMGLRDNQIIRGIIEDRGGLLKLVLNNREFNWQSSKKFKPGDQIALRVDRSATGKVLQPLMQNPSSPTPTQSFERQVLGESQKVMSLLYRPNQPLLLTQALSASNLETFFASVLKGKISDQLNQIIHSLAKVSPEMVRSALVNSGLFGEFRLAQNFPPRSDIKQILRYFARNGAGQNAELSSLDNAVDEIESRQLEAIVAQNNREVSYQFVMPFYDSDPVDIHFERGRGDFRKGEVDWVINLHTNSDWLGEVWSKTTIKASSDIEMIFWAASEEGAKLAANGQEQLSNILNDFGLSLTKFVVLNAQRPVIDPSLSGPGQVLDVST